jgi:hypothetical protein
MRFMAASLKAKCSFCHNTKAFASDEKEEKQTAREMIAMVRGMNKQYFNGRQTISCNSCHNGRNRPTRTPVLAGLSLRHPKADPALKASDVVKNYLAAVGGDFKSLELHGKESDGKESTDYTLVQAAPNKFLASYEKTLVGYDGATAWHAVDGHTRKLWGDNAVAVARTGRWFRSAEAFARYEGLEVSGKETLDGKPCIVLRGKNPADHVTEEFYFEEKSGLLLRVATLTETPFGALPGFTDYANYRKVKGVRAAFRVTTTSEEGEVSVLQFKSAKADVAVEDKMFSPPEPKK